MALGHPLVRSYEYRRFTTQAGGGAFYRAIALRPKTEEPGFPHFTGVDRPFSPPIGVDQKPEAPLRG